jgi:hypothetical protein
MDLDRALELQDLPGWSVIVVPQVTAEVLECRDQAIFRLGEIWHDGPGAVIIAPSGRVEVVFVQQTMARRIVRVSTDRIGCSAERAYIYDGFPDLCQVAQRWAREVGIWPESFIFVEFVRGPEAGRVYTVRAIRGSPPETWEVCGVHGRD